MSSCLPCSFGSLRHAIPGCCVLALVIIVLSDRNEQATLYTLPTKAAAQSMVGRHHPAPPKNDLHLQSRQHTEEQVNIPTAAATASWLMQNFTYPLHGVQVCIWAFLLFISAAMLRLLQPWKIHHQALVPPQRALPGIDSIALLSVTSVETSPMKGLVGRVIGALMPKETVRPGTVWMVNGQTSIMGMQGTFTLTWEMDGPSWHRLVDCTSSGKRPLQHIAAVSMSLPSTASSTSRFDRSRSADIIREDRTQSTVDVDNNVRHVTELGEGTSALSDLDPGAVCWEMDWSGLASELELEDAEKVAIGHWLCTGQWILLLQKGVLHATPLEQQDIDRVTHQYLALLQDLKSAIQPDVSSSARWAAFSGTDVPRHVLQLHVTGGDIIAHLIVDSTHWLPSAAVLHVAGGAELWLFDGWTQCGSQLLPSQVACRAPGCTPVIHVLDPSSAAVLSPLPMTLPWRDCPTPLTGSLLEPRIYTRTDRREFKPASQGTPIPSSNPWTTEIIRGPTRANPLGAWFDDRAPIDWEAVPLWQGEGGHLLCQPTIEGQAIGLFIIDTSTNGLVIDPDALPPSLAAKCERFAFHTVQGLGGAPLKSALCRGVGTLNLGPLMLEYPLFREASLAGVVRGPSGMSPSPRIAGILGYDFLRHCRMEIGSSGDSSHGKLWLRVRRPGGLASPRVAVGWQAITFIGRTPHLHLSVTAGTPALGPQGDADNAGPAESVGSSSSSESEEYEGLFQLALGVGGTGLIVGMKAAERLRLIGPSASFSLSPSGLVTAPASNDQQMARSQGLEDVVRMGLLPQVAFAGANFNNVLTLYYPNGDPDDLQLSCYADGVIGAPLLRGGCLVIDYSHRRISVSQLPETGP